MTTGRRRAWMLRYAPSLNVVAPEVALERRLEPYAAHGFDTVMEHRLSTAGEAGIAACVSAYRAADAKAREDAAI